MVDDFLAHVGRLEAAATGAELSLTVERRHLNPGGRLHGALSMCLHEIAAARLAEGSAGATGLTPLASHYQFLAAAEEGERVRIRASLTRQTRTLLFISTQLEGRQGVLSTANIIQGIGEQPAAVAPASGAGGGLDARFQVSDRTRDPFAAMLGPLYERSGEDEQVCGALEVLPRHVGADRPSGQYHGLRLLADLFLARPAHRAAGGRPVVTLSLDLRYMGPVDVGQVVHAHTRLDGVASVASCVSGVFVCDGRKVMEAAGLWKIVGAG